MKFKQKVNYCDLSINPCKKNVSPPIRSEPGPKKGNNDTSLVFLYFSCLCLSFLSI